MDKDQMLRIAIVDDASADASAVSEMVEDFCAEREIGLKVAHYASGDEFLKENKNADVVFLDIDMPGTNGLEVAKAIRRNNAKIIIIFCTNLEQFAINGYEVNALGYLLKPVSRYWVDFVMKKVVSALSVGKRSVLVVKTATEQTIVNISDIVYVEVQAHNIFYTVLQGGKEVKIKSRGSMREVEEKLSKKHFSRCSACYLINLRKVISIKKNTVYLTGDYALPVSRTFKQEFSESFMKYLTQYEV